MDLPFFENGDLWMPVNATSSDKVPPGVETKGYLYVASSGGGAGVTCAMTFFNFTKYVRGLRDG